MTTNTHSEATLRFIDAHPFACLPNRAAVYVLAAEGLNVDPATVYTIADNALDFDADDYDIDSHRHLHAIVRTMFTSDDDFDDFRLELREALDMLDDDDRAMLDAGDDD